MYKSNNIQTKNTFEVELFNDDGEKVYQLNIYPPKIKILRKIGEMADDDYSSLIEIISEILSKNKEKITVSAEIIEDLFDLSDISDFISDFMDWIKSNKKK